MGHTYTYGLCYVKPIVLLYLSAVVRVLEALPRAVALGPASQAMAGPVFEAFLIFISTTRSIGVVNFIHVNA